MGDLRQVVLLQDRERHGARRGDRLVKVAEVVHVASGMGALEDQTKLSGVKIRNPLWFCRHVSARLTFRGLDQIATSHTLGHGSLDFSSESQNGA